MLHLLLGDSQWATKAIVEANLLRHDGQTVRPPTCASSVRCALNASMVSNPPPHFLPGHSNFLVKSLKWFIGSRIGAGIIGAGLVVTCAFGSVDRAGLQALDLRALSMSWFAGRSGPVFAFLNRLLPAGIDLIQAGLDDFISPLMSTPLKDVRLLSLSIFVDLCWFRGGGFDSVGY